MRVYDLESSIRNADLKSFQKYYNGEIHQEFTNDNLSMLELLFTESSNCGNRMQIAEHLIHQGISFFKEIGGAMGPEVRYPITKELMDRAFDSSRGAYEVMIYAETGRWPLSK